jgi:hypothetical protein
LSADDAAVAAPPTRNGLLQNELRHLQRGGAGRAGFAGGELVCGAGKGKKKETETEKEKEKEKAGVEPIPQCIACFTDSR